VGEETRRVWSSDRPAGAPPPCAPAPKSAPSTPVRVRLERQGRGGKVVTVVDGLAGHPDRIAEIGRTLKARCGAGGTVRARVVEVQGDHRDRVVAVLSELGIPSKRAGG
jgi:translation initiation factor 1